MDLNFERTGIFTCDGPVHTSWGWEELPHDIWGIAPAGPCLRVNLKAPRKACETRAAHPRRYQAPPHEEIALALQSAAGRDACIVPTLRPGSKTEARRTSPPTKRAAVIEDKHLDRVLAYIDHNSRSPESDRVKVLLSCKAGLRAGEIAGLSVRACSDIDGRIGHRLFVASGISKSRDHRYVPINQKLRTSLETLQSRHPAATHVAFSIGRNGQLRPQNATAVTQWLCQLYKKVGLQGCSSHSGRRTFATRIARELHNHHGSLEDLKRLLGHRNISSTECYLEPSPDVEALVHAL